MAAPLTGLEFCVTQSDMNTQSVTKRYESPLRAEQAQATRDRILAAVRTTLEQDPHSLLGIDDLAAASGVNRRTIFRHFPTKEALLEAFWTSINASLGVRFWPEREEDLTDLPPDLFASLDVGIHRAGEAAAWAIRALLDAANSQRRVIQKGKGK